MSNNPSLKHNRTAPPPSREVAEIEESIAPLARFEDQVHRALLLGGYNDIRGELVNIAVSKRKFSHITEITLVVHGSESEQSSQQKGEPAFEIVGTEDFIPFDGDDPMSAYRRIASARRSSNERSKLANAVPTLVLTNEQQEATDTHERTHPNSPGGGK